MASPRTTVPAYAYELIPGDTVNGREVESLDTPDGGDVTVHYTDGDPDVVAPLTIHEVSRLESVVRERLAEVGGQGQA